jgi:alginate O-acetyltransferase complex protein AlgJ
MCRFFYAAAALALGCGIALADPAPGIVGKDGWLFYRYEFSDPGSTADERKSVELIGRIARSFAHNDIAVAVALVPVKMRIYAAHLPAGFRLTPYVDARYERLAKGLRAQGVHFIDLNAPFLAKRDGGEPLFFRLDSHWSPTGADVAAQAIRAAIDADPVLQSALEQVPEEKFRLAWEPSEWPSSANDLALQLAPGTPKPAQERALYFKVERERKSGASLLGEANAPGVTLVGSSYSANWTLFSQALENALQREVLALSVPATQGSWVGLESYLRDDAFQTHRPKLLVWELPERDMRAPPDFKYRERRYVMDDTDWLLRASAWIQASCVEASTNVKAVGGPLADTDAPVSEDDYLEITFSRGLSRLEYVAARITADGTSRARLEASGAGLAPRRFEMALAGDDQAHEFRTPLLAPSGKGYDKLRIYPGRARRFNAQEVRVCRQPEDLLR